MEKPSMSLCIDTGHYRKQLIRWQQDRIASLEAQLKEREFRVSVGKMSESHQDTYWVCLDRGDRPLDAKPWDKGRITPFKTNIADNAYTDAREWAEFLGADKPSPPITEKES